MRMMTPGIISILLIFGATGIAGDFSPLSTIETSYPAASQEAREYNKDAHPGPQNFAAALQDFESGKIKEESFPINVPLKDFLLLDPITVFLMKHRKGSPPEPIIDAKPEDIIAGKYNVQIGVRVTGKVQNAHRFDGDGDWTFDFGDLHLEITPYWQKEFEKRHIPLPQNGQTVRAMGWTYYDYFHRTDDDKGEEEGDEEFSGPGILRKTLWEVHPVQDLEVLP